MITKVAADTFVYATYIRSTPEKVWEALTQGDFTEKYWFGFRVDVEQKAGGKVTFIPPKGGEEFAHYDGKVLAFEPYRKLSYSWMPMCGTMAPEKQEKEEGPSRVTFELMPIGGMVKLRLIHENLQPEEVVGDPNTFKGINNGWPAVLSSMKSLLETGKAIAYDLPKE